MTRRTLSVLLVAFGVGGFGAWMLRERTRTAATPATDRPGAGDPDRPTLARPRDGIPTVPSRIPARTSQATTSTLPTIDLSPPAGLHRDWSDPERDPTWADAVEPVLQGLAASRLSIDHPDASITGTACRARTCTISIEAPAGQADLVHEYLTLLVTIDGVSTRTSREAPDEHDRVLMHVHLRLPEAGMPPDEIARRQRQSEIDYPHVLGRYREYLARTRAGRADAR